MSNVDSIDRSDEELLASCDGASFGEFYDRSARRVLTFFFRRTACPEVAADLTAETFAEVLRSRSTYQASTAPAAAWVFKIARRQLARYRRRAEVSQRYRHQIGMATAAYAEEELDQVERLIDMSAEVSRLRECMDSMPRRLAEALWLRIAEQRPFSDVALQLGCTEGAARVRVSRGLKILQERLGDQHDGY